MSSNLTIYTASAGAGKTHTLTGEYLRLALSEKSPGIFRRIQAVTFTNKATAEMKERILEQVHLLSIDPDKSPYRSLFEFSTDELKSRSRALLAEMLNDYNRFRIRTIDSFFQEVLRSFARELSLDGGYRIMLDESKMLNDAATRLISDPYRMRNRDKGEDEQRSKAELLRWLKEIAADLLKEGRGHNLLREIKSLGRELFREDVVQMSISGKLPDRKALRRLMEALRTFVSDFESDGLALADKAADILQHSGCTPDLFYQGNNGPVGILRKVSESRTLREPKSHFSKLINLVEESGDCSAVLAGKAKRSKKTVPHGGALDAAPLLYEQIENYKKLFDDKVRVTDYYTAQSVISFIGRYGVISELHRIVAEIESENNTMLLSGSSGRVSKLLDGEDFAPMLYERIGTLIDHQMIDEFQDTSRKQYDNFQPLLRESLSRNKADLVVGDVKQSIYRFRNSDRRILSHDIAQDFRAYSPEHKDLAENWRSTPEIIALNNALFAPVDQNGCALLPGLASERLVSSLQEKGKNDDKGADVSSDFTELFEKLKEEIIDCYRAPRQQVPKSRREEVGAIVVHRFDTGTEKAKNEKEETKPSEDSSSTEETPSGAHSEILGSLSGVLLDLQDRGYKPCDIAILVRTSAEAAEVAEALCRAERHCPTDKSLQIVSAEALSISSSLTVRFVVFAISSIAYPGSQYYERMLRELFLQMSSDTDSIEGLSREIYFKQKIVPSILRASKMGLYEMADLIYQALNPFVTAGEQPYVLAFLDLVMDYCRYGRADARAFVQYWQESGCRKKIFSSSREDTISLMTIHKSKGLGFPVVLVPFPDWASSPKSGGNAPILWCNTRGWQQATSSDSIREALSGIDLVPVRHKSDLEKTFFFGDYCREKEDTMVDALNVLYVAFTRAKSELHFWLPQEVSPEEENSEKKTSKAPKTDSDKKGTTMANLLSDSLARLSDGEPLTHTWHHHTDPKLEGKPTNLPRCIDKRTDEANNNLQLPPDSEAGSNALTQMRIRTFGADALADNAAVRHGRAIHRILEQIQSIEDLPQAVASAVSEGILACDDSSALLADLSQKLSNEPISSWFDGSAIVLNEAAIIGGGVSERRPDRILIYPHEHHAVIIDYKLGTTPLSRYRGQVQHYKTLLQRMGYEKVDGYLWNIDSGEVLPV